jgi:hypothetical protein
MEGYFETMFFYGGKMTPIRMKRDPFWQMVGTFHPDQDGHNRTRAQIQTQFAADNAQYLYPLAGYYPSITVVCEGEEVHMLEITQIACLYEVEPVSLCKN